MTVSRSRREQTVISRIHAQTLHTSVMSRKSSDLRARLDVEETRGLISGARKERAIRLRPRHVEDGVMMREKS